MAPLASTSDAQRRFSRRVLLFVVIGYVAVLLAATAAWIAVDTAQDSAEWVAHTFQVEGELETIARQGATMRAEAVIAAYLRRPRAANYRTAQATLRTSIDHIARLTADNPRQQARIPVLRDYYRQFDLALDPPADAGFPARLMKLDAVRARLLPLLTAMRAEEDRLLRIRQTRQAANTRRFSITLPLAGMLMLVMAIASVLAIRRFTGDLARSRDELATLNEGLEAAVQVRTRDLQRANEEIQRFAYIVSHDLRSPLVNVMGFTAELDASRKHLEALVGRLEERAPELLTDDARDAAREDLPEAIGFIRSSTQKMDRLINAILRLSREGRRTLAPERVDATAVVRGAIDSMQHRIDDVGADVLIAGRLPELVTDRLAFEQIMTNLVENATKYLKPGRPGEVRVGGRIEHGRAIFSIRDNGRGIDRRDHERIFDLFRRSGAQDQPGEGIGLAHVRALAYRLGGTVDVESELDKGATFRVNLPAVFAGEQDSPT